VEKLSTFLLSGLRSGVAVVDQALRVRAWSRRAEDPWGLRAEEVRGKPLLGLEIGLPADRLPLSLILTGKSNHEELEFGARNRRGQTINCRVTPSALPTGEGNRQGVVLPMEEMTAR
jgi:two-component system CheB/CheR fusion protein